MGTAISTVHPVVDWEQTDLYRFFALVFCPPSPECFELLSQPTMRDALHDLWSALQCEGEFPGFAWFATYELYEAAYIALFDVGVPEPPVPLFESAHDKTHPAQEIALENTFFYEVLGLKSDPGRGVPDYLITQLEFLAALRYTGENTPDEAAAANIRQAEADFIRRHLMNWISLASSKLARSDVPGFVVLMTLLSGYLSQRVSIAD